MWDKQVSQSDETLIFLHLPKAGGMTLHRILERRYPHSRIYTFDGRKPLESVARFEALPETERARYRLLKGHVLFGLHRAVPNPSTYITLLRDPVERVISQYYYAKSRPEHYLYARLNQEGMSLYEYAARRTTPEISNQQTSLLAGLSTRKWDTMPTQDTLRQAQENLKTHFRVVGLTEQFDTSLLLLKRAFGWGMPFYLRENVTSEKPKGAEIEPRARELLAELNALDLELYAFARELFDAQCTAYGSALAADVKQFRSRNQIYQRVMGPAMGWWQRLRARA